MCRPRIPAAASLERILLLVIAGLAHIYATTCPPDVPATTSKCLERYNSQVDALASAGQHFYTGVDVEMVRLICGYLRESAMCAHNIKRNCPDTEHADIETIIGEHISIAEVCHYENFYEVYARNQNCFLRLSASSEKCYNAFRAQAEPEIRNIYVGDQSTLNKYCSFFETFIECIRSRVLANCNAEAAQLVPTLVRPSVKLSEHCKNDTARSTTVSPVSSRKPPRDAHNEAYSKQTVNGAGPLQLTAWTLTFTLGLALAR